MGTTQERQASYAVMRAKRKSADERRVKTDNHPAATAAKIEIRRNVLGAVQPAKVLDAFCGTGGMYRAVWKDAASYVGCDVRPWSPAHPPRYVADNLRLLRSLDLSEFNVFDFDAYGSPWEQMEILMARRRWHAGEVGGIVLTDGSGMKLRKGGKVSAIQRLTGIVKPPASATAATEIQKRAIECWVRKAGVVPVRMWSAMGFNNAGGQVGGAGALYTGIVFRGA